MSRVMRAAVAAVLIVAAVAGAGVVSPELASGAPGAPSGLAVRNVVGSGLDVRWEPAPGAISYELSLTASDGTVLGPRTVVGAQHAWTGLTVGESYRASVAGRDGSGAGTPAVADPVTVVPDASNEPVTGVTARVVPGTTKLDIAWTLPAAGSVPFMVAVRVKRSGFVVRDDNCAYPCTSKLIDGLEPGTYSVDVAATNFFSGWVWVPAPSAIKIVNPCATGAVCVSVDGAAARGAAQRRAQGLLHGLAGVAPKFLDPLAIAHARVSETDDWQVAVDQGASITLVLSGLWHGTTWTGIGAAEPWDDWARYEAFLTRYVKDAANGGLRVDWFEIQNEPYGNYFDRNAAWYPIDDPLYLEHHKRAYRAIKAADPDAKVLGPSLGFWDVDRIRAFLDYAVLNELHFEGYSWHEIDGKANDGPARAAANIGEFRRLLAERPSLGSPKILLNEYFKPQTVHLPGWEAAWVASLEGADVDESNRSCPAAETCFGANLDELIDEATQQPRGTWWVRRFYADQVGTRLDTTTSNGDIQTFATTAHGTLRLLVGRAETCAAAVNPDCYEQASVPAYDVGVTVGSAWAAGTKVALRVDRIPAGVGTLAAPVPVLETTAVVDSAGRLTFRLPQVADGDALTVVAAPANGSTTTTTMSTTTTTAPTSTSSTTTTLAPSTTTTTTNPGKKPPKK